MTEPSNLRDAADVWDDCYRAFYYGHTMSAITYPIEADRAQARAELVAEIVAWMRKGALREWGADCTGASETEFIANHIEAQFGGTDA